MRRDLDVRWTNKYDVANFGDNNHAQPPAAREIALAKGYGEP
jgi:hypothetical protein